MTADDSSVECVEITTEQIKLDSFLKWAGAAMTGGEAKFMVEEGRVLVNGAIEQRRGHKLSPGDTVEVQGVGSFKVVSA
jgi:ribosome-associated protein